ncbi:hypothetical protein Gotri_001519 [Gossypium trilobum]|uniref:Benzyl alcohol O-benzoyltransferase-like n=1 Tax=Gossypium trilobum TaxID=34281 RepID=A0A7J9FEY0_9ROSI|nr:hypothetical protein [Gossypium trilobum]
MSTISEMARGATACSISPIWERHLLDAGDPPRVTFHHHEYDEVEPTTTSWPLDNLVQRSFFFGPVEVSTLRIIITVRNLLHNPLGYTVELKQAKASMTKEYAKSVAALMVLRAKQLNFTVVVGSFVVSDLTKIGFEDIDFGWGNAVFAGAAKAVGVISFFVSTKSKKGEVGTSVPICLPAPAMERFEKELDNMLKGHPIQVFSIIFKITIMIESPM